MAYAVPFEFGSSSTTGIGWIGAGVMGRTMRTHIITIFDRTSSKGSVSPQHRSSFCTLPSCSGFSVLCGILHAGLNGGGVLVDMITSEPSITSEFAYQAAAKECTAINALVTRGENGLLANFAGGKEAEIRGLEPLFSLMGKVNYMWKWKRAIRKARKSNHLFRWRAVNGIGSL